MCKTEKMGIPMTKCKFYVNAEKRTVVCVIPNTCEALRQFLFDNFYYKDMPLCIYTPKDSTLLYLPDSFTGKAVCAEEDEWNEETGKLIAYSRAKNKFYKSFFRRANKYIQTIDSHLMQMIDTFNEFGERIGDNDKKLEEQIKEMVK